MEDHDNITIEIPASVEMILEERGIKAQDIRNVIAFAEETQNIYNQESTGHSMAYCTPAKTTYWVEYEIIGNVYRIHKAYSHRMEILHGFNMAAKKKETTSWFCVKCGVPLETATIKLKYLEETFGTDVPACPTCQRVFVSEEDAVKKMALAEKMLEDK